MPKIKVINKQTQTTGDITTTATAAAISLDGCLTFSAAVSSTVSTPSAKTFDSGVAGSLVVQDLTYTADLRGTAGNSITIAYTGGGTAGAEVVTVNGNAISVQIESGASTATEIKTAVDASVAASALISVAITGTGSNAQVTAAAAPLAGGVASEVDVTENSLTIPSHGLTLGLKGQLTSTGTLPTGYSTATDYFVIVVDSNTIKLATSLVNAQAGTAVDISSQGSSGAVNTFTPTALAGGSVKLQKSNDGTNWTDEGNATNITSTGLIWLEKVNPTSIYMRLYYTLTAGTLNISTLFVVKGPN